MSHYSYKKLFKQLWREVQSRPPSSAADQTRARLLGLYLQVRLLELKRKPQYLAAALDVEQELVDAILEGTLPLSELDSGLLEDIAAAVNRKVEVLHALLGKEALAQR